MSVGAVCFTSSGSNGVCWVLLVAAAAPYRAPSRPPLGEGPHRARWSQPKIIMLANFVRKRRLRMTMGTNGPHISGWHTEAYNKVGALFGNSSKTLGSRQTNRQK